MNRIGTIAEAAAPHTFIGEIVIIIPGPFGEKVAANLIPRFEAAARASSAGLAHIAHWRNGEARPAPPKDFNFDADWKDEPGPPYPTEFPDDGTL